MTDIQPIPLSSTPARKRRHKLTPLLVDANGLSPLLSAGVRTIRTWDQLGKIPEPVKLGGRVLWRVREIRRWIAAGCPPRDQWAAIKAAAKK